MSRANVLPSILQQGLLRAHPSAPVSNQVLQQVTLGNDVSVVSDVATGSEVPTGYPYGYGESVDTWATSGTMFNTEGSSGSVKLQQYQTSLMMWGLLYAPQ